ncbi:MAG TPA: Pls/PosA family non-ribosomal peptide synthetase [Pseudonocardia sp.]|uniref:Pls/PosA family non-ribosomal peptide synthetase n=1 Tax=Pseudonocardia sp. TaxID=60912 RepID=UPI002CE0220A|nr:Pls/PosA family non-ribosomal peptide synthetase [Pseudonocardia sp.]HTF54329.1 Pls/PosA family non-ribosomal peptide synthetase [Pseudonocardia sp.]
MGDWKRTEIPLWSAEYLRFWLVKTLIQVNPAVLLPGPVYQRYLRLLGAKIGKNVLILSRSVPVVTDLVTIGDGTVIHKESMFSGYHAEAGMLRLGPVTLGRDVYVGEKTVLDIDTALGDGAQLGHSSSLHPGQSVPAGASWHGSPAEPCTANYRTVAPVPPSSARKAGYVLVQLLGVVLVAPALFTALVALLTRVPALAAIQLDGDTLLRAPSFYLITLAVGVALFVVALAVLLVLMFSVPPLLNRLITPGRDYSVYGVHYQVQQLITRLTNSRFAMLVLGDSSFIIGYLRDLGYDLDRVVQTGSNFGTQLVQDSPFLSQVGSGTIISDGLSLMNAEYSNTSFRMSPVRIAANNFFGNDIAFPAGAKVGDNVLLATKVMVPVDGPVRENTGLLGSPPFEIPRSVPRDPSADAEYAFLADPAQVATRLAAKNRHNAGTIATVVLLRALGFGFGLVLAAIGLNLLNSAGALAEGGALAAVAVVNTLYSALLERAVLGFRRLKPQFCSIYDHYFWTHERLWKVYIRPVFAGTAFQGTIWRLAGVRMGRRVFDDGCAMPEKSLVTIGDDAVLNAGSVIQCHSLEDGFFKSDHTTVGAGATIGVKAFVHYGVRMGDGAVLAADAFVLKGEEVEPGSRWHGNPAAEARAPLASAPTAAPGTVQSRLLLPASAKANTTAPIAASSKAGQLPR